MLAVLLGVTMWLQFKLNPAAMDPIQQQVFMIMPWVLMFVMAPFAAGLLLYWITSNILTLGAAEVPLFAAPATEGGRPRRTPPTRPAPPSATRLEWRR